MGNLRCVFGYFARCIPYISQLIKGVKGKGTKIVSLNATASSATEPGGMSDGSCENKVVDCWSNIH